MEGFSFVSELVVSRQGVERSKGSSKDSSVGNIDLYGCRFTTVFSNSVGEFNSFSS